MSKKCTTLGWVIWNTDGRGGGVVGPFTVIEDETISRIGRSSSTSHAGRHERHDIYRGWACCRSRAGQLNICAHFIKCTSMYVVRYVNFEYFSLSILLLSHYRDLSQCGLTDADNADLQLCLDTVGRSAISILYVFMFAAGTIGSIRLSDVTLVQLVCLPEESKCTTAFEVSSPCHSIYICTIYASQTGCTYYD